MSAKDAYILQPFHRRAGELQPGELIRAHDEAEVFRRGKAMLHRVDGMRFYRIDCSSSGDQWTEIELLAATGEADAEEAA